MDSVSISRDIRATPEELWDLVADVTRTKDWSPETAEVVWKGRIARPVVGATFLGTNRNGAKTWKTTSRVTEAEPGKTFSFDVKAAGMPVATWTYAFEPIDGGCRVTESWNDRRNPALRVISKLVTGVQDRKSHNRANMEETLRRLAEAAATERSAG